MDYGYNQHYNYDQAGVLPGYEATAARAYSQSTGYEATSAATYGQATGLDATTTFGYDTAPFSGAVGNGFAADPSYYHAGYDQSVVESSQPHIGIDQTPTDFGTVAAVAAMPGYGYDQGETDYGATSTTGTADYSYGQTSTSYSDSTGDAAVPPEGAQAAADYTYASYAHDYPADYPSYQGEHQAQGER